MRSNNVDTIDFLYESYCQWSVDNQIGTFDKVVIRIKPYFFYEVLRCEKARTHIWTNVNTNERYFMGNRMIVSSDLDCDFEIVRVSYNCKYTFKWAEG